MKLPFLLCAVLPWTAKAFVPLSLGSRKSLCTPLVALSSSSSSPPSPDEAQFAPQPPSVVPQPKEPKVEEESPKPGVPANWKKAEEVPTGTEAPPSPAARTETKPAMNKASKPAMTGGAPKKEEPSKQEIKEEPATSQVASVPEEKEQEEPAKADAPQPPAARTETKPAMNKASKPATTGDAPKKEEPNNQETKEELASAQAATSPEKKEQEEPAKADAIVEKKGEEAQDPVPAQKEEETSGNKKEPSTTPTVTASAAIPPVNGRVPRVEESTNTDAATPFFLNNDETEEKGPQPSTEEQTPVKKQKSPPPPKKEYEKSYLLEALAGASTALAKDVGRELFGFLRKTSAEVLTKSLPDEERQDLLVRMGGSADAARSVGETIATENVRSNTWEKEKEKLLRQAEQAAEERVQNELAVQKQRMEQEKIRLLEEAEAKTKTLVAKEKVEQLEKALQEREQETVKDKEEIQRLNQELQAAKEKEEKAKAAEKLTAETPTGSVELRRYSAKEYRDLSGEQKQALKDLREMNPDAAAAVEAAIEDAMEETRTNPILGPVVEDFGYKRLHILSAGKLGAIPIWEKQRIYRHDRVRSMAAEKWKTRNLGLPGIIGLYEDENGQLSIIDGQHRVGMMMLMREKQRQEQEATGGELPEHAIDFDRILVEVYPHQKGIENHAQQLFAEINKAESVKMIDMPGISSEADRNIITEAVEDLRDMYPRMFSYSQNCRTPNVNMDNLRDSLFGSAVMQRYNLATSRQMLEFLLQQNQILGETYSNDQVKRSFLTPRAWQKAQENQFFLGIDSTWLYK